MSNLSEAAQLLAAHIAAPHSYAIFIYSVLGLPVMLALGSWDSNSVPRPTERLFNLK